MQQIRIDFDNPGLPQSLGAVEGESQSRIFQAALYKSGAAYTAPAGAVYSIMYRGFGPQNQGWYDTIEDGAGKRAACTVSGNVVTCELARQALRVPGHLTVVLCLTDAKGYMLKSWPIMADVRNDGYEDTVEVESFFYITQITSAEWTKAFAAWEDFKATIDPTLTLSGKAADAKATGAAVDKLEDKKADKTDLDIERKRIDVLNEGGLNLKDEVIDTSIKAWLADHPEATTTVQDGAITETKINAEFLPYIIKDYVMPEMFGAKGDGITDDTVSIKSAFATGRDVHLMANKTYLVTETITVEKLQNFNGKNSAIIFNPLNTLDAGLVIANPKPTVYTEKNFVINNISLDCNGKVNKGLCAQNIVGNIFDNISIKGALTYGIDTNYNSNVHANNYNHITINGGGFTTIGIKGSPDSVYNSCTSIDCITGFELNDDIANDCSAWISNVDYFKGSKAFAANYGVITMNNCIIDTVETGIYVPADVIGQATNLRVINNRSVHEATTSTNIILNFAGIPKNSFFAIDNLIATTKYKASNIDLNNYPNIKISNAYNSATKDSGLHKATPLTIFDGHDCGYQCDINGICSIFFNEYQKNYTASFSYGFLPENMRPPMNFSIDKTNYSIIIGTDGNVQFNYRGTGEPVKTVGACITYVAKF